jgi:hypothetical protein
VISVLDTTVNGTEVGPKYTAVAEDKLFPMIVTLVPPAVGPNAGESAVMLFRGGSA